MKIVADAHIAHVKNYFSHYGELVLKPGRDISNKDVKDADVLLVRSITPVHSALLTSSKVKFVGSMTAGIDHLDTAWLNANNVLWYAAAGFNAPPVADYIMCVIAALQKKGLLLNSSKKAAVIGVGHVGRLVVERLKYLGFQVVCVDPIRALNEKDFVSISLQQVEEVDLISLHVPLTRDGDYPTDQFINQQFLQKQKPGCVLLNASRGGVIHADDLKQYGRHCHWCFDVWPHEPHIDPVILANALIATPHIAGYSVQSKMRGIEMIHQVARELLVLKPITLPNVFYSPPVLLKGCWPDHVLEIFNPAQMTNIMRRALSGINRAAKFDELRHAFHDRQEFDFDSIKHIANKMSDEPIINLSIA